MNVLTYVHLRNIYRSTGVGRVARELTEQMAMRDDVQIRILADQKDYNDVVHKVGGPWLNYRYHLFPSDTSRQQARWFLLNRPSAEAFWPDADIMYCTAESYVPVRTAKLVVACHDAQHFEPGAHQVSPWLLKQRMKWKLLFGRLARTAAMFHMISHFAAERMAHFFPDIRDRLSVIPNAASEAFFLPPTASGNQALDALSITNRRYILVPGGLQHRKNADLILDAWPTIHQLHPDLKLVVINHSAAVYLERARQMADSIILGGYQEEEQLVALYSGAQLVWFPTRYDGFGMPVIEAMACGTPVVSSNTTGIPEVAGDAALLLSPARPQDHVDGIDSLLRNESELQLLSDLGRRRAASFRWNQSAETLVTAFRTVI